MKMNLKDKYADYRGHSKIDSVVFYDSAKNKYFLAMDKDDLNLVTSEGKRIYDFEIEYKQNNNIRLKYLSDIKEAEKTSYINISKYSLISKVEFLTLKGNVRVTEQRSNYKLNFMFIDLSQYPILMDNIIKYCENDYIEYWCRCLFVQLQENLYIKIPFYTQSFTRLKKDYFKLRLFNKLINGHIAGITDRLTYNRNINYTELSSNSCIGATRELYKYLNIELIEQALKNKKELLG